MQLRRVPGAMVFGASKRQRHVALGRLAITISLLSILCGCSSDMEGIRSGSACTRTSQCERELSCVRGSCRALPSDAGMSMDAGDDDSGLEIDGGK